MAAPTPLTSSAGSGPAGSGGTLALDPLARTTRRLDLVSCALSAGVLAVFEMGGAIAKKGFNATDHQVALVTSGQSLGLIFSFFIAHLAARRASIGLVFWPEVLSRLLLIAIFCLTPSRVFLFVAFVTLAQMFHYMTNPARMTVYHLNYPTASRGRIVGRIRQVQILLTAFAGLGMSLFLNWSDGERQLVRWLGAAPFPPEVMIGWVIPGLALLGLLGSFSFRGVPLRLQTAGP